MYKIDMALKSINYDFSKPFFFLSFFSESYGLARQPPLEVAIAQATECMKLMSKAGIGSCAFAGVHDYLH